MVLTGSPCLAPEIEGQMVETLQKIEELDRLGLGDRGADTLNPKPPNSQNGSRELQSSEIPNLNLVG